MNLKYRIAIVDDQAGARRSFSHYLSEFEVKCFSSAAEFLDALATGEEYDLVVADVQMPGMNGIELLERIKTEHPGMPVIIASGMADRSAIESALQGGAFYFIHKELARVELPVAARIALKVVDLEKNNRTLRKQIKGYSLDSMTGSSEAMINVIEQARRASAHTFPVLIQGESGTGKELMARCLHNESSRAKGPFIPVNVSETPPDLVASALFGHRKGSFSGAVENTVGFFGASDGGTLFLDEIGELREDAQVQLLRVLQEKQIRSVGDVVARDVDVWILAATNRDLSEEVKKGNFRLDLYQRLNVISLTLPPLRERKKDIPELASSILEKEGYGHLSISDAAMNKLLDYRWEGNVRELENVMRRAIVSACTGVIDADNLQFQPVGMLQDELILPEDGMDLKKALEKIERSLIIQALERTNWVKSRAADLLGLEKHTLLNKINRKYRLNKPE